MPNQATLNKIYTDEDTKANGGYKKASSRLRRAFIKLPRFFPYVFNKNSLDFGCGGGFVAYALSFIAKSSVGVDINQKAVTYAKKKFNSVNFYCKDFHDLLKSNKRYDFIHSSEIIEHVSDVNLYMKTLSHLTNTKGHVYITTPDLGHPKVPENITEWDVLCPPIHVQHFTKKTVTILFKKYGFDIIKFYKNKKPGLVFLSRKL
jgi:2-polyprenyl-3-methyl-5-hydroxy-6-metoxy-1,4-benzoquinol methylase